MIQEQVKIINICRVVLDQLCIVTAGLGALYYKYLRSGIGWHNDGTVIAISIFVIIVTTSYFLNRFGIYGDRKYPSFSVISLGIIKTAIISFAVLATYIFLFQEKRYSREFFFAFFLLTILLLIIRRITTRMIKKHFYKNNYFLRKILLVGCTDRGQFVSDILSNQLSWGHEIVGCLSVEKNGDKLNPMKIAEIEDFTEVLKKMTVDEVIFAVNGNRSLDIMPYLEYCKKVGIAARILPSLWRPETADLLQIETIQGVPFFSISSYKKNATGILYKRVLDLIGATVGLSVFILLYPFIAAAIRLDSKGPILFKQKRVGMNGRFFILYKFRTMCEDAESIKMDLRHKNEAKGAIFKIKRDPRITKVGAWLRKTSLDEIPQFINVLKGEMSLVGTRPPTVEEVAQYDAKHYKRISSKPGITGLWQVSGRNSIKDFEDIVKLDIQYLENWRFFDDIKILLMTLFVVFYRKGAY